MREPPKRVLDLFSGAGGAAWGLHQAWPDAEIVGIDIKPQPRYPFRHIVTDAMTFDLSGYDFIWASPPCQHYTSLKSLYKSGNHHPDFIASIRMRLLFSGVPYVIENVEGAPIREDVILCGTMFGLGTKCGAQLRRHRLFEASFDIAQPRCMHSAGATIGVHGSRQQWPEPRRAATIGVYGHGGGSSSRDGILFFRKKEKLEAMGIDWMSEKEVNEAIPPAYSRYIASQYLAEYVPDRQLEMVFG